MRAAHHVRQLVDAVVVHAEHEQSAPLALQRGGLLRVSAIDFD